MASRNRRWIASWSRPSTTVAAVIGAVLGSVSLSNGLSLSLQAAPVKSLAVARSAGPTFQDDILPIFERNCLRCHDRKVKKGRTRPEHVLRGPGGG